MKLNTAERLEFDKVKEQLGGYARTYLGREHVNKLQPSRDQDVIRSGISEQQEAVRLIEHGASVPIPSLDGLEQLSTGFGKGFLMSVTELARVALLLEQTGQLKRFMGKKDTIAPQVTSYALSLHELQDVRSELERCIQHGQIADQASTGLAKVRKKIAIAEERLKKKLDGIVQRYRSYMQEHVVSMRGDRYVIPVKKEHRKQVPGPVLDESASGQTVFVEPADIAALTYERSALRAEESREEMTVLGLLTDLVESRSYELGLNLEIIGHYDFVFAKAKYALAIGGRAVGLDPAGQLRIRQGRHPLLGDRAVPLDFELGGAFRTLIITGPNTGGKTVALKTVGLLTLMVQSGLLVPAAEESRFPVYDSVLADIGDGQSLEQSLSTFSSHVNQVIAILREAGPRTLILLDELAAGTDPGEGIGLSIAVLEELYARESSVIATTHFNEIKRYAEAAPGFENARMEFDVDSLQPLYRLTIGEAGYSYAFQIATKLGMPARIIVRSQAITYGGETGAAAVPAVPLPVPAASSEQSSAAIPGAEKKSDSGREAKPKSTDRVEPAFELGDCVWIHSLRRTGIVCGLADGRGNLLIQIMKEKVRINRKRLSLYIERKQLYPEGDYDMDIVFESKEVRKKRKIMRKRHDDSVIIIQPPEPE